MTPMTTSNEKMQIIDNTYFSIGFPNEKWDSLVFRENYLSSINDILSQDIKLIFIEGEEDSGKTTLCGQFAKRNSNQTISVFFNPLNNLDYNAEFYCTNVVYQIKNILHEEVNIEEEKFTSVDQYNQYVFQLRKTLKKRSEKITLIIDGLEEKIDVIPDFMAQLFSIIPFGHDFFQIILTGNKSNFFRAQPKLMEEESRTISLTGFSTPEMTAYLGLTDYLLTDIHEIYKITKGFPGRLKTLKRILNEGYSLGQISNTTSYKNWVELDSSSVDVTIPFNNAVLSLLSLSKNSYSVEQISKICSTPIEETDNRLSNIKILEIGKYVTFVSNSHRRYFSNMLRGNEKKTRELLINYYSNSETIVSLLELPQLYAENNDWPNVLNVLTDDYSEKILDHTESLKTVNDRLKLGLLASEKMDKYTEIWRYSVESSILNELDDFLFWESEIEARISIDDFAGAISLAESAVLKIDRFKLLALIARRQKEIKKYVDEDLINAIEQLYKSVDLVTVREKIYDIVADLLYSMPNLAIEIIEKSSGNTPDKNINDWIIAKLSVAAIDSDKDEKENTDNSKKLEALENINRPLVDKIRKAISFLVGNYTALKVIEEVKKMADPKERLRLLRLWLQNNRSNIKAVDQVIEMALNELIVSSSETAITFDTLNDLAFQLPYVNDLNKRKALLKRFISIDKSVPDLGLTKNRYRYELSIFHTQFTFDEKNSIRSLNRLISEVDKISDIMIKIECFAEIYHKLFILRHPELPKKISFVYQRIMSLSKDLYDLTAKHFVLSKFFLRTISKRSPHFALKICVEMNTKERRDKGRMLILESYLQNNLKYIEFKHLKEIEDSFENIYFKEITYLKILERYAEALSLHYNTIQELLYYFQKIDTLKEASQRTLGEVLMYRIVQKNQSWESKLSKRIENKIYAYWHEIEADWEKIDSGYSICTKLAKINKDFAKKVFDESEKIKNESWVGSLPVVHTYLNTLSLILKAFTGVLLLKDNPNEEEKVIEDLIARIPSEIHKLTLWTELGFNAYLINKETYSKKILEAHILPIISSLVHKKAELNSVLDTLTLIHVFNSELANIYVTNLVDVVKEIVYAKTCQFYITKRNPFEIYDHKAKEFKASYSDITKAVSVLNKLSEDETIYLNIEHVCDAIFQNKELSRIQVSTLCNDLEALVDKKLPDAKNIRHDGYKIIALAKINTIKREMQNASYFWVNLVDQANKIPNMSDALYVKNFLLKDIPFNKLDHGNKLKTDIYNNILSDLRNLKNHYEFVERVTNISETMYSINRSEWKDLVTQAFQLSSQLQEESEVYSSKKSIIDTMYRLDPVYAKELIKLIDDDSKEKGLKDILENRLQTLELADKIKKNQDLLEKEKENARIMIRSVIEALRSLNSNKIAPKKVSEAVKFLPIGNKLPLHEVYPVYLYYLSNCIKTYNVKLSSGKLTDLHEDNFRKLVKLINLIQILSHAKKSNRKIFRKFFIDENFTVNKVIRPGSKEEAFQFIKNWISEEVEEFIIIADPYFCKDDIEILKIIKELKENIEIDILGSKGGNSSDVEVEYQKEWRRISEDMPPFTNLTFCWIPEQNNQTPFHDRWILTKNGGLRLGTSINSLGLKKESELSIMEPSEALNIRENLLFEYINHEKKTINNFRISYKSFSL